MSESLSPCPPDFTLAHMSDVHLGPLPAVPLGLINPKRLAGALNWYRKRRSIHAPEVTRKVTTDLLAQRPDHIAVSGDLTNLGLQSEIVRSAAWLQGLGSAADVSVVPGNHDIYSTVRGRRLGVSALEPWSAHFASCATGSRLAGAGEFPFVRIFERNTMRVALIGLNSAVETPPLIATGSLGATQRAALARILEQSHNEGCVRIVMLHHPPLPGLTASHHELTDAQALAEILQRHGAELVLHGHNHRRMINMLSGPDGAIPIVGVPSASAGRTYRNDGLAGAHFFEFRQRAGQLLSITLVARGITLANKSVTQLERTVL